MKHKSHLELFRHKMTYTLAGFLIGVGEGKNGGRELSCL